MAGEHQYRDTGATGLSADKHQRQAFLGNCCQKHEPAKKWGKRMSMKRLRLWFKRELLTAPKE